MKRPLCTICVLFLIIQCAGLWILSRTEAYERDSLSETESLLSGGQNQVSVTGTVERIEEKEQVSTVYLKDNYISIADHKIKESKLLVYIKPNQTENRIRIGNRLCVSGEAEVFSPARNPGNFDQKFYYEKQGIRLLVWADHAEIISGKTDRVRDFLQHLRSQWRERLIRHLGEYYGNTMSAVLLGEKSGLDGEMKKLYQKSGIGHILAISGLHMSFIGAGLYGLLRRAGLPFAVAALLGGAVLILYTIMIGGSVSAVRALIMFLIRAGADVCGRNYDLPTALAVSAAAVCACQPLYLKDAAYQLSYGAILGIALLSPVLGDLLAAPVKKDKRNRRQNEKSRGQRLEKEAKRLVEWLTSSLAVTVFLMGPLLRFYFEVPPYSALLNLLIIPAMPLVLGAGILGSLLTLVSDGLGHIVFLVCRAVLTGYDRICALAAHLPGSRLVTGQPETVWLAVYYGCIGAAYLWHCYLRYRAKKREETGNEKCAGSGKILRIPGMILLFSAIVMPVACKVRHHNPGGVQVTVLDVGQGDGIFIRSVSGKAYFIDGGSSDVSACGAYRIEPFLLAQGVDMLEYAFLSHGDSDHLNGMTELLENQDMGVRIKTLVLPPEPFLDESLLQAAHTAAENGTRVTVIKPGDKIQETLDTGEFVLECLAPDASLTAEKGSNASSMVLGLTYGGFSMLFTGDLESEGEAALTESGRLKKYTVLKAAHHGSRTSGAEAFLRAVSPHAAIISAGVDNRYGHPHPETLERLEEAQCKVYSTADCGAVSLWTDGERVRISGFVRP